MEHENQIDLYLDGSIDGWVDKRGEEKEEVKKELGKVESSLHFGAEGQSLPHLRLEIAVHLLICSGAGGELRGC